MMKGKNVDFDAEKWKNEMTSPEFEPGTFSLGQVSLPLHHKYIEEFGKKTKRLIFQCTAVAKSC